MFGSGVVIGMNQAITVHFPILSLIRKVLKQDQTVLYAAEAGIRSTRVHVAPIEATTILVVQAASLVSAVLERLRAKKYGY